MPTSGSKAEITDRIAYFLDTGNVLKPSAERKAALNIGTLTEDAVIEPNIVCSEKHRAFFSEKIGKSFSFNVPFQKWLKANAGKNLHDASYAGIAKRACRGIIGMSSPTFVCWTDKFRKLKTQEDIKNGTFGLLR